MTETINFIQQIISADRLSADQKNVSIFQSSITPVKRLIQYG